MTFPEDFNKTFHNVVYEGYQWLPNKSTDIYISIVGGARGLYGDGVNTFEIMINDDVYSYQTVEEINKRIKKY